MPNDCTNSFTITNITTDQWRQIAATFQVCDSDEEQDFLKTFCPEPDYAVTPVAHTFPEVSAQLAKTEEERERILKNEPTIREDSRPPLPGKMTPLQPNQYHPPGGLMEQSNASLQRDGQS